MAAIRAELGPDAWKFDYKQVRFNTYTTDCDHPVASSNGNGQQRSLGKLSDLISLFSNHQEPVTYLLVDSGLYQQPAFKARVDQLVKEAGILQ